MSDFSDFSLDQLIVEEEEIREPVIMPVSVLVSETRYDEQDEQPSQLTNKITQRLRKHYKFRKDEGKRHREGFLDFEVSENRIECIYARETPIKIDYEKGDLKINTTRIRLVNPSYRVKVRIVVQKTKSEVVLFGGQDTITARALTSANYCIRECIKGGFATYQTQFSKDNMDNILASFGFDIQYVFVSPGDSERLKKLVKKRVKGEVKEILQYFVRAKFAGYRVVASPLVLDLVKEGKINILEIEGRLSYGVGKITTRVSSSGRITFFVPEILLGKNQTAYQVAEELYKRIITRRTGARQRGMEDYLAERS